MKPAKPSQFASPRWPARVDWTLIAWGAALVALVVMAYWPTLSNRFIWDDEHYVENNETLRSAAGLYKIWFQIGATPQYYPLVHSTFWVEYHLWGLNPLGYHVVNLLLHACNALLLWRLLNRLAVPGAWFAAALFAVHPVCVESVAWITERKNVLSLALALSSMLAYLRFSPPEPERPAGDWRWYACSLALYVAALWSKTVTSSLPAVLLVIYWWKQGRLPWREARRLAPFFAVGLSLAMLTVWMERTIVGAEGNEWNLSPIDRILIAGRALWFYAGKLAWPHPLIFFYPRWTIDSSVWWQYLYPLAAGLVIGGLFLARRWIGRGPLAAVLVFSGVLVPALGFFDVFPFRFSFVADHFQYHASIALIALAAAALTLAAGRWFPRPRWLAPLLAGGLLVALGVVTFAKTPVYRNAQTVYEDTVRLNPGCWAAHHNLGTTLHEQGKYAEAIEQFRRALAADFNPRRGTGHLSWGVSLSELGRDDEALAQFRLARTEIEPEMAWKVPVSEAKILARRNKLAQAEASFAEGVRLAPAYNTWLALAEYADFLQAQQRYDEALDKLNRALRQIPNRRIGTVEMKIANCLSAQQRYDQADFHFEQALRMSPPEEAWIVQDEYGLSLLEQKKYEQAIARFRAALDAEPNHPVVTKHLVEAILAAQREAVRQAPQNADARIELGANLLKAGDVAGAIVELRKAVELQPASADTHNVLGAALAQSGDLPAAIREFEVALNLDPKHDGAAMNLRQARDLLDKPPTNGP